VLYTEMSWVVHWYFKVWVLTFWNLSQKLSVEWHWLMFAVSQIFLHFGQFYFYSRQACNKRLANWTAIADTLTWNGFKRNAKPGFNSWKSSNLTWNFSSSLTMLVFFHFVVCNYLFAKNIRSHSDIAEMKECFRRFVSLKILILFWEFK